jgi:nucleotide-binding universal stress UspA family protein
MDSFKVKNILIPTDFSKTGLLALEHASFMGRLFKANLYLLHVIETDKLSYSVYDAEINLPTIKEIDTIVLKKLNDIAVKLKKEFSLTVKVLCSHGSISAEIVEAVNANDIDLVIMGTHGISGFDELFIGSNAHKTVTICPCPVISVQSHAKKIGFTNIVVPINDDLHSRQKVDYALTLAKKYNSKIHILGLLDKNGDTDPLKLKIKLESVEKVVKKTGLTYECKTVTDDNQAAATLKYSKKVKADLIVVLTGHESKLTGIFLGAFAKQIVNHSKIPVMSIRPIEGNFDSISLAAASPF